MGAKFLAECDEYLNENTSTEAHSSIKNVKEVCLSVLDEALKQVTNRLPAATDIFKNLSKLSPHIILNQLARAPFGNLPLLHLAENSAIVEEQYRKIIFVDWRKEPPFVSKGIPNDSELFWIGVLQHKGFKDLAKYKTK